MPPGITGVGSIVFRNEEAFFDDPDISQESIYKDKIAPLKGALEQWYFNKQSLLLDCILIFQTAFVVLFPKANFLGRLYSDLPSQR